MDLNEARRQMREFIREEGDGIAGEMACRVRFHRRVRRLLVPGYFPRLTDRGWHDILRGLWALEAYHITEEAIKNNQLASIRDTLRRFLYSHGDVDTRIARAKAGTRLHYMGEATLTELLMWFSPAEYPVRNKRSEFGLCAATNDSRLRIDDPTCRRSLYFERSADIQFDPPFTYREFRARVSRLVPIMQDELGRSISTHRYLYVDSFFSFIYEKFRSCM
jgi:hypothetical protein